MEDHVRYAHCRVREKVARGIRIGTLARLVFHEVEYFTSLGLNVILGQIAVINEKGVGGHAVIALGVVAVSVMYSQCLSWTSYLVIIIHADFPVVRSIHALCVIEDVIIHIELL
jgi:hypothetical protein